MKLIKKLMTLPSLQKALAALFARYIKIVYNTSHLDYINRERLETLIQHNTPIIVAFWHGRMALLPCAWQWKRPVFMLLSKHRDGMLISRVLTYFGIHSIFGSTKRGGVRAGLQILQKMKEGAVIGVTPDGPRGPNQTCALGVITLAGLASKERGGDVYIVPGSYAMAAHKCLRSWDKFMVPFPFSKGVFIVGAPLPISSSMTDEELDQQRLYLESRLNAAQAAADDFMRGK